MWAQMAAPYASLIEAPPGDLSAPGGDWVPGPRDRERGKRDRDRDRVRERRTQDRPSAERQAAPAEAAPAAAPGTPATPQESGTIGRAPAPSPFSPSSAPAATAEQPIFGEDSRAHQSPFREAVDAPVESDFAALLTEEELNAQCPTLTPEEAHAHPAWLFPPSDPDRLPEHRKALTMCREALKLQLKASQLLGHSDTRITEIRKEIALANFQIANARDPRAKLADQERIVAQLQRNCEQLHNKQSAAEEAARALALASQTAKADLAQASTLLAYYQTQAPPAPALADEPMLEHQLPFQQGSSHRTAAAAAMPAAQVSAGTETPILEIPPSPPFLPAAPEPIPVLEQPFITSLTAAMQSNADNMAREVATIKASFEAQTQAMKESMGNMIAQVSQITAGQLVPAASKVAGANPGGAAPSAASGLPPNPLFKFGFTAKPGAAPVPYPGSHAEGPTLAAAVPAGPETPDASLPPASRSARQAGWDLTNDKGDPVSMASVSRPPQAAMRGRSEAPARVGAGRGLAGIKEESPGDSPRPARRRTTSPRRPRPAPGEGAPSAAAPSPSAADAMAADEAAALEAEAAIHQAQAQAEHAAMAQAALQGTVFHSAPPSTAPA